MPNDSGSNLLLIGAVCPFVGFMIGVALGHRPLNRRLAVLILYYFILISALLRMSLRRDDYIPIVMIWGVFAGPLVGLGLALTSRAPRKSLLAAAILFLPPVVSGILVAIRSAQNSAMETSEIGHLYKLSNGWFNFYLNRRSSPSLWHTQLLAAFDKPNPPMNFHRTSSGTRFALVEGPGTLADLEAIDASDGNENTLVFVECSAEDVSDHDWDVSFNELEKSEARNGIIPAENLHPWPRGLVFADTAMVRQIRPIPLATFRALTTANGDERVTRADLVEQGYLEIYREPHELPPK